jgi:hypothetical protein
MIFSILFFVIVHCSYFTQIRLSMENMMSTSSVLPATWVVISLLGLSACQPDTPIESSAPADEVERVTLIHHARIYNFDAAETTIADGALAVSASGEILAIGDTPSLLASFPQAEMVDLEGKVVLPGLIDSHGHLMGLARSLTRGDLTGTSSKEEVIQRLQDFAPTLGEGDWLLGEGWDQNDWPDTRFPTRADLDREFANRPVWLRRIDGHAAWGNTLALAQADRDLSGDWNPPGGLIHRDAGGEPTGILLDNAMGLVDRAVPPVSEEVLDAALGKAIDLLLSRGLTGVHDPGLGLADVRRLQQRISDGRLPLRVYVMADGMGETLEWLCQSGPLFDVSGRLVMRSVKLYADGALGSRGAALLADYSDDPGNRGLLFQDDETVQDNMRRIMSCGLQVGIHAIGDAGNHQALDAYAAVIPEFPHNPGRHRIEHAQVLALEDIPRLAQLGLIAAMQPTHATSDMYWAVERLGPQRITGAYAWRSLLDSAARLALGSDFPVENVNPMLGIHAAITRQDRNGWPDGGWYPDQRISRHEAVRGFTLDAAYAAFMEDSVGSLEAGKKADFIVLDRDIMSVPAAEIPQIHVLQTWVDGIRVY